MRWTENRGTPLGGKDGDPIIGHPDVLRLVASMRADIMAMRSLLGIGAAAMDMASHNQDKSHQDRLGLLVPIIKGWLTELSLEITSQAVQVHGGMGFIEETGAAQHYRDARILPIYEGTTAIQANDLVFRKTLRDGGASIMALLDEMDKDMNGIAADNAERYHAWLAAFAVRLTRHAMPLTICWLRLIRLAKLLLVVIILL